MPKPKKVPMTRELAFHKAFQRLLRMPYEAPWAGRALHWLGHGLIYATIALIVGAILGAGVVGGILALGR